MSTDVSRMLALITFHPPTALISANANRRLHWSRQREQVKLWREASYFAALIYFRGGNFAGPVRFPPSVITVTFPVPDNRRRDPSNFSCKAIVDGLGPAIPGKAVGYGLWPDDDAEWVTVNEPILAVTPLRPVSKALVVVRIDARE